MRVNSVLKFLRSLSPAVIIIGLLAGVNAVLVSLLFYLLIPTISPNLSVDRAQQVAERTSQAITAGATFVFAVDLTNNARKVAAFTVKDQRDLPAVTSYIRFVEMMRFTSAVNVEVSQALIAGQPICYQISTTGIMSVVGISDFLKDFPNAVGCAVPIKNRDGILRYYVLAVWREGLDYESKKRALETMQEATDQALR